jgi:hypothetical protein
MDDPDHPWPTRGEARELGCTCEWIGSMGILRFDYDCPILQQHKDAPMPWLEGEAIT